MADRLPCNNCGHLVELEATVCPQCGQPSPVGERDRLRDLELGRVYSGRVTSVTSFGTFVEIAPGVEGLLHVSEYIGREGEKVAAGGALEVELIDIDERGRVKLSRKFLLSSDRPPTYQAVCDCGKAALPDTRSLNWPPRASEGKLWVPFRCVGGHLFTRGLDSR